MERKGEREEEEGLFSNGTGEKTMREVLSLGCKKHIWYLQGYI